MITVIGDRIVDVDVQYTLIKKSPDYNCPVYKWVSQSHRPGGAHATSCMIEALQIPVQTYFGDLETTKTRCFVDGVCTWRVDWDDNLKDHVEEISDSFLSTIKQETKLIVIQDYGKGIITRNLYRNILSLGIPVLVDPCRDKPLDWYAGAKGILPNKIEAQIKDTGDSREITTAKVLCDEWMNMYPCIAIKLGMQGCVCGGPDGITHIPAKSVESVDVCGAGDMFIASVAAALYEGSSFLNACKYATEMATLKCLQVGATPVYDDNRTRLRRYLHEGQNFLANFYKTGTEVGS